MQKLLAIILAAGRGRRLETVGGNRPKCLLPIGTSCSLTRSLDILESLGYDSICIVAGYQADQIQNFLAVRTDSKGVHLCLNPAYATKNNASSLLVALTEHCHAPFILLDGDLLFEPALLQRLIADQRENLLVTDTSLTRLDDEAMKVGCRNGALTVTNLSKAMEPGKASGEYIGMAKFSKLWAELLLAQLTQLATDPRYDNAYYEDIIATLLSKAPPLEILPTNGLRWFEIDTPKDLARASQAVTEGCCGFRYSSGRYDL